MIKITAFLAASALTLAACGGSSYGGGSSSSSSKSSSSKTSAASSGGAYGKSSSSSKTTAASSSSSKSGSNEVEAYDNYFQPKTISGKPGSTVKLELKNEGQAEHTFTVDAQKISKSLAPGSKTTVSLKIPSSGSVQFYCQYHKSLGMTGTVKAV